MNFDDQNERRIQLRAEMTDLLFQINCDAAEQKASPAFPEQTQTYGIIVILISGALVVWFGGKTDATMTTLFGAQGVILGSFVVLASQFSLATKLNRFANWLQNSIRNPKYFQRSKDYK